MSKRYEFSRHARRAGPVTRVGRGRGARGAGRVAEDEPPVTRAEMQELDRRVKDLHDRTRYVLLSALSPKFMLYYSVSEDTYGMNEPAHATLFKRRAAAIAIRRMLGGGVEVVRCRVDRRGRLVLNSLASRRRHSPQKAVDRR